MRHDDDDRQRFGKSGIKIQGGILYLAFLLVATMGILLHLAEAF